MEKSLAYGNGNLNSVKMHFFLSERKPTYGTLTRKDKAINLRSKILLGRRPAYGTHIHKENAITHIICVDIWYQTLVSQRRHIAIASTFFFTTVSDTVLY